MDGAKIRLKFPMARRTAQSSPKKTASAKGAVATSTKPVSKLARMLALAHHIERAVESAVIESNADAARALGLSRARMTQVMNLLLLSPEIQARILSEELVTTEHDLRRVVNKADWKAQGEVLVRVRTTPPKAGGGAAKNRKAT